jgi:hypothetical protein
MMLNLNKCKTLFIFEKKLNETPASIFKLTTNPPNKL